MLDVARHIRGQSATTISAERRSASARHRALQARPAARSHTRRADEGPCNRRIDMLLASARPARRRQPVVVSEQNRDVTRPGNGSSTGPRGDRRRPVVATELPRKYAAKPASFTGRTEAAAGDSRGARLDSREPREVRREQSRDRLFSRAVAVGRVLATSASTRSTPRPGRRSTSCGRSRRCSRSPEACRSQSGRRKARLGWSRGAIFSDHLGAPLNLHRAFRWRATTPPSYHRRDITTANADACGSPRDLRGGWVDEKKSPTRAALQGCSGERLRRPGRD